jgi:oxaloacetate decarboxylase alpha subunit
MLNNASEKLNSIRNKYLEAGILDPKALSVNPNILTYQVPGGMLSNLMNQLKAQNSLHLYDEVLKEVPKVRKELGYPPLVTPLSQMVGTQSVLNVLSNERYKIVPKEITDYCHGRYGKSPGNIDKAILEKVVKDENEVITCRPADLLKPEFNELKEKYKNLIRCDEDVLSIALFESVAIEYLKNVKEANEVEEFNVLLGGEN